MSSSFAHILRCSSALCGAVCLLVSLPALCQNAGNGKISGIVAGQSGSPVAGAHVVLQSSSSGSEQKSTEADKDGRYSFSGLSLGAYKVSATASGFRDSGSKLVILTSAIATEDLTLVPLEPGGEASQTSKPEQKSPPAFSPAGMRGNIAPSGYASGLSNEETAHVRASANALGITVLSTLAADTQIDCSQEPRLLRDVERAPDDFGTNHALGTFYLGHGEYSKAIQYLGKARSAVPGDLPNSSSLAAAMIGGGRAPDATTLLEQLLTSRPSDAALLRLLAFAYKSSGDSEKSITAFHKAAASDAGFENQYDCGVGLIQLGAFREAFDLLTVATEAHPESARLWLGLGIAAHLLERKDEAVAALFRAANADPGFLPPLALLAELSSLSTPMTDDLRRRIAAYLVAHPEDAQARFAYALVLSKAGSESSPREVASQLQRVLQEDPGMARAHFMLGDIESDEKNLPSAIDEFIKGLKFQPANAGAHYRLALLYRRTGQQEEARKEMDLYRELHGESGDDYSVDVTAVTMPSIQPVPVQPSCSPKPE